MGGALSAARRVARIFSGAEARRYHKEASELLPGSDLHDAVQAALAKSPLLQGYTYQERRKLVSRMRACRRVRGQEVVREGTAGDFLYVIVEGECDVSTRERGVVGTLRPCDTVGDVSAAFGGTRTATVTVASKRAKLLSIEYGLLDLSKLRSERTRRGVVEELRQRGGTVSAPASPQRAGLRAASGGGGWTPPPAVPRLGTRSGGSSHSARSSPSRGSPSPSRPANPFRERMRGRADVYRRERDGYIEAAEDRARLPDPAGSPDTRARFYDWGYVGTPRGPYYVPEPEPAPQAARWGWGGEAAAGGEAKVVPAPEPAAGGSGVPSASDVRAALRRPPRKSVVQRLREAGRRSVGAAENAMWSPPKPRPRTAVVQPPPRAQSAPAPKAWQ